MYHKLALSLQQEKIFKNQLLIQHVFNQVKPIVLMNYICKYNDVFPQKTINRLFFLRCFATDIFTSVVTVLVTVLHPVLLSHFLDRYRLAASGMWEYPPPATPPPPPHSLEFCETRQDVTV